MSTFTEEEVAKHCRKNDLWIIIDGKVYDMTSYVESHPGGDAILRNAGADSTLGFQQTSAHRFVRDHIKRILSEHYIGRLKAKT